MKKSTITKKFKSLYLNLKFKKIAVIVFITLFAIIGVHLVFVTHASTPYASTQPETGVLSGGATIISDSSASGGQYVKFGSTATTNNGFIQVCGLQLCLNGQPYRIHGSTAYGSYSSPSTEIALAQQAKINTLAMIEFDTSYHNLADVESSATWTRADAFIAAASAAHIHIVLHIAELGQSLVASGYNFSSVATGSSFPNLGWQGDYDQYLSFIANRVNTVSGVTYKNDPTIAKFQIWGEIPSPGGSGTPPACASTCWTATQMQAFYANTIAKWHSLAPNILVSSGGFSYLNSTSSGLPWQSVMALPDNATCDVEVNSPGDKTFSVPLVTNYCKTLNKPWFESAWSSCYQPNGQTYATYTINDSEMATHAQDMYNVAAGGSPATYPGVGSEFWNLRDQGTTAGTCSLSPNFPLTWAVIQNN